MWLVRCLDSLPALITLFTQLCVEYSCRDRWPDQTKESLVKQEAAVGYPYSTPLNCATGLVDKALTTTMGEVTLYVPEEPVI